MRILFIGGTGTISSPCSLEAARLGHELFHLNRGNRPDRVPQGVTTLKADIRDPNQVEVGMPVEMAFKKLYFDRGVHNYFWKARPFRVL